MARPKTSSGAGATAMVTDNLITAVSTERLAIAGGTVIDGGGRTLMPGLPDTHVHLAYSSINRRAPASAD